MNMDTVETLMAARSLAGHDKDTYYIIADYDETYVWLTDGRLKPIEKPKKKKRKHIQIIKKIPENLLTKQQTQDTIRNEDIRRALKLLEK